MTQDKESIVDKELIAFVKRIKKQQEYCIDKHLCDHLLWKIEEVKEQKKKIDKMEEALEHQQQEIEELKELIDWNKPKIRTRTRDETDKIVM